MPENGRTVRLLGVAGVQQKLDAKLYFAGDSPKPVTLDSDLTTELATFNADKHKPLALGGKIVETPTEADFSATITDWTPGNGETAKTARRNGNEQLNQ